MLESKDVVPYVTLAVLPPTVIVAFNIELELLNAVSSVPTKSNLYALVEWLYNAFCIVSVHTGGVTSWKNVYVLASLQFPVVSYNALELIEIVTFPPLKFLTVIGNVFVFPSELNVPFPIVKSLELTTVESVFIVNLLVSEDDELFNCVLSVPTKLNVYVPF